MSVSDTPMKATCHCGAITITVPRKPESVNECKCTICRRYAAAWAYYNTKEVTVSAKPGSKTNKYVWGDRIVEFHFCEVDGNLTHWWPADLSELPEGVYKMGVNTNMMDPDELKYINREINVEMIFQPQKSKDAAHREDKASYQ